MRRSRPRKRERQEPSWKESAINRLFTKQTCAARKRGLVWEIGKEQFGKLLSENCHYCGTEPSNVARRIGRKNPPFLYSGLDRLDNTRGYTTDNVVPCCAKCNRIKSDQLSAEEARVAIRALLRYNARTGQVWVKPQPSRRK